MGRSVARRLTVAELAKKEGVHPSTIRRRLRKLDAALRGRVIMRNTPGNKRSRIYVTLTSLEKADRRLVEERRTLAERFDDQEKKISELKRTVASLRSALSAARELLEGLVAVVESGAEASKSARRPGRV